MLSGLDDVDWSALRDACGSAEDLPALLEALTLDDGDARGAALDQLGMRLCPERESVSEASAFALPFLLTLARAPEVAERGRILALVHALAGLARAGRSDQPRERAALGHALLGQLDSLLTLLGDRDAEVRARAALTLGEIGDDTRVRARVAAALGVALAREVDADGRVACVRALERLGAYALVRGALGDGSYAVRLAAAFALLAVDDPGSPSHQLVRTALSSHAASEARYGEASRYRPLSWVEDVCGAGRRAAEALLPELLVLLRDASAYTCHVELEPLLALFFPDGAGATPSDAQRAIAATVARNRHYFGRMGDASAVLRKVGLPDRARPLRAYAERGPGGYERLVPPPAPPLAPYEVLVRASEGVATDAVTALDLVGDANDDVLELAARLPRLRQLLLKGSPITARGMTALASAPALRVLHLEDLTLDTAAVSALARSASLRFLTVSDVSWDEHALGELGGAARLEFLCLRATSFDAAGFARLAESSLETLVLEEATLTADVVARLAALPGLRKLVLDGVLLVPADLAALRTSGSLRELVLRGHTANAGDEVARVLAPSVALTCERHAS